MEFPLGNGAAQLKVEISGNWLEATPREREILTAIANALDELQPAYELESSMLVATWPRKAPHV